jgi:DNA-binding MarR family transcriptional regulator
MPARPPISDLTSHLGFWLRMVSNHVSHAFAAKIAERGVTVAEWCVLRTLYRKAPMAPSQVAAEMGMSRGAISKLADRLIAKSLIARTADANDGRAQTLALTNRGIALVPGLAALADRNDAQFFQSLTKAERETLRRLLRDLAERGHMTAVPIE